MTQGKFRLDIEGMRALAVIAVLLFHGSVPWAEGGYVGVDVFFVISGFLITGLLLREMETTGGVQLSRFYARRARRLLPASFLTLAATAVMTLLVLPANRWASIAGDLSASALYVVNWRLAGRSVDYLAADTAASPVQHFWSLSVEEQFYAVWPLLMILVGVKLFSRSRGLALKATLGAVFVLSFVWSVWYTGSSPGEAYFATTTRLWELALGGGLALSQNSLRRLPRPAAEGLAIAGVSAICLAVLTYGPSTSFPSFTALLPTVGAAALIAAGTAHPETTVGRALSLKPLVWIGGLSYSIYLFHWPMVVGAEAIFGQPLSPLVGIAVVT
ncbi:MAG TPA: acyltransferase, partial [Acidimicrobiia bacterium]|nr:acyltransferase [Acidimicrobiia bacterium]